MQSSIEDVCVMLLHASFLYIRLFLMHFVAHACAVSRLAIQALLLREALTSSRSVGHSAIHLLSLSFAIVVDAADVCEIILTSSPLVAYVRCA